MKRVDVGRAVIRVVDVYPYRENGGRVELLLLRRSTDVSYAGAWRMVGGKIHAGETAWQAARRELAEETGLSGNPFWALPSVNAFYEWEFDRVNLIPAFAARLDGEPQLDAEHEAYAWLDIEAAAARLQWPEQERLARLTVQLASTGFPPELVVRIEGDGAG